MALLAAIEVETLRRGKEIRFVLGLNDAGFSDPLGESLTSSRQVAFENEPRGSEVPSASPTRNRFLARHAGQVAAMRHAQRNQVGRVNAKLVGNAMDLAFLAIEIASSVADTSNKHRIRASFWS
jgi:hypothetical protein